LQTLSRISFTLPITHLDLLQSGFLLKRRIMRKSILFRRQKLFKDNNQRKAKPNKTI